MKPFESSFKKFKGYVTFIMSEQILLSQS